LTIEPAGNQQLLKDIHRMMLVRQLCSRPGLSRADLANAVGLTKSTVSLLVRDLIDEGWLVEREVVATGELGRRPTPLFIEPRRLLLLGIEVGIESVRVVVTSLTGDVLARTESGFGLAKRMSAKACIGMLASTLFKVSKQLSKSEHRVIGIGMGLPGGVDEARGFLHSGPHLGWGDVPMGTLLAESLAGSALANVPLYMQNEADVAALGEMEFSTLQHTDSLLYLSINQGVGAGVIVGDRLLTGRCGFAGEVGHMVLQLNGPLCSCGRHGCAEALIGPRALLRTEGEHAHSMAEAKRLVAEQDAESLRAAKKAGSYLGVLLNNLASAYDPGCIVVGGAMVELGDVFLQPAMRTLNELSAAANLRPPKVRTSRFGTDAVAVGAAALVRYRLTRPLISITPNNSAIKEAA